MLWLPWVVERWADHVFDLEFLFEFSFSCVKRFEAFQNSSKIHFSLGEVLFIKVFTYVKFRILMNRWCEKNIYIIFHALQSRVLLFCSQVTFVQQSARKPVQQKFGHSCLLMDPTKFCPFFTTSCLLMDPKTSCLLMDPNQDFPLSKSHVFWWTHLVH